MSSRILVLGSGGREHALAWRLERDPERPEVLVAPGNDGIAQAFRCLGVRDTDPAGVVAAARAEQVSLVVIAGEAPLAAGVSDALAEAGIAVSGCSRAASRIEASKWFAKEIMHAASVPTAAAEAFEDERAALAALERFGPPWVVKADGLAAGKGVLVSESRLEAETFLHDCLVGGRFGPGRGRVVLEQYLAGEEASVLAVCDGERHLLLPAARDYKRAYDGDRGANTGGMGGYAPTPAVTAELEQRVSEHVITPVLRELAARGTPYRGTLYAGLMITPHGPRVIEFNARFGDPEAQCVLPLLEGSLGSLLASAARGRLEVDAVNRNALAAVTLAIVAERYPESRDADGVLGGLDEVTRSGVHVFHAGTRRVAGEWTLSGGRAAYLTATADSIESARQRVGVARSALSGSGWRCRGDIAQNVASTTFGPPARPVPARLV